MHNISEVSLKIDTEVSREAIWESRKGCPDSSKALRRDHACVLEEHVGGQRGWSRKNMVREGEDEVHEEINKITSDSEGQSQGNNDHSRL